MQESLASNGPTGDAELLFNGPIIVDVALGLQPMLDVGDHRCRIVRIPLVSAQHVGVDVPDLDVAFGVSDQPLVADLPALALSLEASSPRLWWDVQDDGLGLHGCAPCGIGISDPAENISIKTG